VVMVNGGTDRISLDRDPFSYPADRFAVILVFLWNLDPLCPPSTYPMIRATRPLAIRMCILTKSPANRSWSDLTRLPPGHQYIHTHVRVRRCSGTVRLWGHREPRPLVIQDHTSHIHVHVYMYMCKYMCVRTLVLYAYLYIHTRIRYHKTCVANSNITQKKKKKKRTKILDE
jgi:hypothetical protein